MSETTKKFGPPVRAIALQKGDHGWCSYKNVDLIGGRIWAAAPVWGTEDVFNDIEIWRDHDGFLVVYGTAPDPEQAQFPVQMPLIGAVSIINPQTKETPK